MLIEGKYLVTGHNLTEDEKFHIRKRSKKRLAKGIHVKDLDAWWGLTEWKRHELLALATLVTKPHMKLTGFSAALVLDLPVEGCPPLVELRGSCSTRKTPTMKSVNTSQRILDCGITHTLDSGMEITTMSYEDIIIDFATWHGEVEAIAAADSLFKNKKITKDSLTKTLDRRKNFKNRAKAKRVINYVTARSESPRESMLRMKLLLEGFGDFYIQADVYDEDGKFLGRVDFFFPELGIAIEYDGGGKYNGQFGTPSSEATEYDALRHHKFTNEGITLVRINNEHFLSGQWLTILRKHVARAQPHNAVPSWRYRNGEFVPRIRKVQ